MSRPSDSERLIAMMALAMQGAQFVLERQPKDAAVEAALSSLTIALNMEAEHWQRGIELATAVPRG